MDTGKSKLIIMLKFEKAELSSINIYFISYYLIYLEEAR